LGVLLGLYKGIRILLLRVRRGCVLSKLVEVVVDMLPSGVDMLKDRDVKEVVILREADIVREIVILRRREFSLWNMLQSKELISSNIRHRRTSRDIDLECR
jgi:hypothetical protein